MKYSCKDQETIIEIKHLEENILKIWWDLPDRYNGYVLRYGKENDKELRRLDRKFARYINEVCTGSKESAAEFEFEEYLRHFMEKVLNISSRSLEIIFKNNYLKISREFMERARETDGSLTMANIFQGLRNVWIMQLMQIHFHLKPVLTDSVFAYSMLYPLTDNLLDDSSLKKEEKRDFNR